jgi:CO/xanthine dehydrogenase FAD-binding subunit
MPDKCFLNITGLPELRGIETTKEHISFGSLCTFTEVLRNEVVHRDLPNLVRSARATGALAIQNRGTLGGNIVNASPAADTPPSLLAYGAELELASLRGRRWIPYERFHLGYKQMDMAPDELLTRIRIPRLEGVGFHFFRKVGTRAAQAISKTCLASYARLDGGRVAEIRIGLGSVAPVPARARHTEALLLDKPLDRLPIREARAALMEDISPIDDIRSTAKYRRIVTANVLEQMLKTLAASGI